MSKKFEIKAEQVPISQKTMEGAHLNSDDIHIFCRVLSIWSDPLEEELDGIRSEVKELRGEVKQLRDQVSEITKTVDCTKKEVDQIKEELKKLKRVNAWWHIAGRWISGVVAAVYIAWLLYINYWKE